MADEIAFGYVTGADLKYGAYQPDGTVRTAAGTSLTEVAGTGLYLADDADVIAGDLVIVKSGTVVVGAGEYLPAVTATAASLQDIEDKIDGIEDKVDIIDTNLDGANSTLADILTAQERVKVNTDETKPLAQLVILKNL